MQQLNYNNGNGVFLRGSCQGQTLVESSVEFCTASCEERTWACEAEESPLLETVAGEQLMKIQQVGRRLGGCCGDL
jgi:hypothetical protein